MHLSWAVCFLSLWCLHSVCYTFSPASLLPFRVIVASSLWRYHTRLQLATFPTPSGTVSVCSFVLTDSSPLRTLSRSWEKGPDWAALLLVPGHRAQVAELIGCTSFRCLALGDEIGSKYGCLEKTLQTQLFIGSRQLSYISEEMRLVVKGKYTFACQAEDRVGCCLKA